jgi:hypothetical protein
LAYGGGPERADSRKEGASFFWIIQNLWFWSYSFVTLTIVGYGDLIPIKLLARTVAFLEGFVGQFYVAVLVAWLVGMFLSSKDQNSQKL